jgi:hypothetical protein
MLFNEIWYESHESKQNSKEMSKKTGTHVAEIASVWAINRDFAKY